MIQFMKNHTSLFDLFLPDFGTPDRRSSTVDNFISE